VNSRSAKNIDFAQKRIEKMVAPGTINECLIANALLELRANDGRLPEVKEGNVGVAASIDLLERNISRHHPKLDGVDVPVAATEPMRAGIRLLGTILGDTVREQNGDEVFDFVERARVESLRVRRSEIDRAEMSRMFDGIDIHLAIPTIRAFGHFALLANVAEDIHRERRRGIHVAGEPPQDSSLAATYAKLDLADLDSATVADALQGALVSPVITAHPTETRRRTVFVTQHRITELMRLHAARHTETDDGRNIELELRRQILTLWQTALIRLSRLQITDEIDVGLRYYPAALFKVIPQVNAEVRDALRSRWPDADLLAEPILRPGSWIGGDRDGNPNVTADVVRLATGSAAFTALARYLAELTDLEQELSMSTRLMTVTPDVAALADACPDAVHLDEPYRRALRTIRGRLTATAADILDHQPQDVLDLGLPPYGAPAELRTDRTAPRCWPTIGWPDCENACTSSGFICADWICGKTPTCTKRWSASCSRGPGCIRTIGRCPKTSGSSY
jgi:phosphoenolpyruvate carboxylase